MSTALKVVGVDGLPIAVAITTGGGATPTVYSDPACTQAVTMPATITADTTFYLTVQGPFVVSTRIGRVELGPQYVTGSDGALVEVPVKSDPDTLKRIANPAGGTEIDVAERLALYDVQAQASPTVFTEVEGMTVVVPPQAGDFKVTAEIPYQFNTGTAAAGTLQGLQVEITDFSSGTDVIYHTGGGAAMAGAVANRQWNGTIVATRRFGPSSTTRRFRVLARQLTATPTNWLQAILVAQNAPSGTDVFGAMLLQAVAL